MKKFLWSVVIIVVAIGGALAYWSWRQHHLYDLVRDELKHPQTLASLRSLMQRWPDEPVVYHEIVRHLVENNPPEPAAERQAFLRKYNLSVSVPFVKFNTTPEQDDLADELTKTMPEYVLKDYRFFPYLMTDGVTRLTDGKPVIYLNAYRMRQGNRVPYWEDYVRLHEYWHAIKQPTLDLPEGSQPEMLADMFALQTMRAVLSKQEFVRLAEAVIDFRSTEWLADPRYHHATQLKAALQPLM